MPIDWTSSLVRLERRGQTSQPRSVERSVVLGVDEGGKPYHASLPKSGNNNHGLLMGASGAGKSILATILLAENIRADLALPPEQRTTIVYLDPKGDLDRLRSAVAAVAPERLQDFIILNPFSDSGFPFNLNHLPLDHGVPLSVRSMQFADLVAQVSTGVGSMKHLSVGARQHDTFLHTLLGALTVPGGSPLLAQDALASEAAQKVLAAATNNQAARAYLNETKLSDELRSSCSSRLRLAFSATELQEKILSAPSCISIDSLISPGKIVGIDLGTPPGVT